jgi:hypothetical protein
LWGLNILASATAHLGSIDRIERVVKLLGMVNAVDSYTEHPQVINGCSELFKEIWGEDLGVGGAQCLWGFRITRRGGRRNRRNFKDKRIGEEQAGSRC